MIPMSLVSVAEIVRGELISREPDGVVSRICIDSRDASPGALFVALAGQRRDGHEFINNAFENEATAAIISDEVGSLLQRGQNRSLIVVKSPLRALQLLAGWWRRNAFRRVLTVTGSNGKTIVKDALPALLMPQAVYSSPGSYNSQLGLPLAILAAERATDLAILEAGVSQVGDMAALEEMAAPDFGILTNVGMAHFASFGSREAIAREKISLFQRIPADGWVILPANDPVIEGSLGGLKCRVHRSGDVLSLKPIELSSAGLRSRLLIPDLGSADVDIKTRSPEIVSDLEMAATAAFLFGRGRDEIANALSRYTVTPTRMEIWTSHDGVRIINDAHSSDPISVNSALRSATLGAQPSGKKIFAFAGMRELGEQEERLHRQVGAVAGECGFTDLVLVGGSWLKPVQDGYESVSPKGSVRFVNDSSELRECLAPLVRAGDTVLFKGPRNAGMVEAARIFTGSVAQRSLWIDLAAIEQNVARLRRRCAGEVRVMAMLKALAYGTELVQLASWMSEIGIHHIGVSSTGEGVEVRKRGVEQDIYVFLPDHEDVDNLIRFRLVPIIYSNELAETFARKLSRNGRLLDVHLKVDTGMHRLGVEPESTVEIIRRINNSGVMRVCGICTHFAAADDPSNDDFTRKQIDTFDGVLDTVRAAGFSNLVVHAANTAGAVRFPSSHYNMIRVGIGLYGIYPSKAVEAEIGLDLAIGVTSRITSIRDYVQGETLGYGRAFKADRDLRVGVVPFGYDDGMPWRQSDRAHVLVEGRPARLVGRVSMDQMQVDLTDHADVGVGAEVLLYGAHGGHILRPEEVALDAGTIPHELLIRLGRRAHRVFLEP